MVKSGGRLDFADILDRTGDQDQDHIRATVWRTGVVRARRGEVR
jgi:hypothetical protein